MFTFYNIRYDGDTDFVFVFLLLDDKILLNPIKILEKKDQFITRYLDYHVVFNSCRDICYDVNMQAVHWR